MQQMNHNAQQCSCGRRELEKEYVARYGASVNAGSLFAPFSETGNLLSPSWGRCVVSSLSDFSMYVHVLYVHVATDSLSVVPVVGPGAL